MDVRTYRARSLFEAIDLVRRDLGPDASVLHTRELPRTFWDRLRGGRPEFEVRAAAGVRVPERFAPRDEFARPADDPSEVVNDIYRRRDQESLRGQLATLHSMVAELCERTKSDAMPEWPQALVRTLNDLIENDVPHKLARDLVQCLQQEAPTSVLSESSAAREWMAARFAQEIRVTGPIQVSENGHRTVALIGPTGVGKTTTLAKLAAIYRLRGNRRVGLITVDTYRIAAIEQLRTYAQIIDLPMEVVASPREMRDAVSRLSGLDLILIDTAGRGPSDQIKINELRAVLAEAQPDEVHLVLGSTGSAASLVKTAEQFRAVPATAVLLTKLDEACALGNVLPLLRSSRLPVSYVTTGQNVPNDIQVADAANLARAAFGLEGPTR